MREEAIAQAEAGAQVIDINVSGLGVDEERVLKEARRRLEVGEKILGAAEAYGIAAEDVVIDPLVMAVGAEQGAGLVTLEAIRLIRREQYILWPTGAKSDQQIVSGYGHGRGVELCDCEPPGC